jgi:Fic family protein
MRYIYQNSKWPEFYWNQEKVFSALSKVKLAQGHLLGKMESLGFRLQEEAVLDVLTQDVLKSSEIEGKILDLAEVRSSIAKHLGLNITSSVHASRDVDGIVEMMLDATQRYKDRLTKKRILGWHASLFPTGYSGIHKINAGKFRDDKEGPMQVVSGSIRREKVHYQAPSAESLESEMSRFLNWYNTSGEVDGVLKAALAHLWFITLHPFDDGNGRIARALADSLLARSENTSQRFYSMSAQIRKERRVYYDILEKTQKGSLDITNWMLWFLDCLLRAIGNTKETLAVVLNKALFWKKFSEMTLNERQKKIINKLLDEFEGKLTSSKWAKICKTSQDSANRDILDLIDKGMLDKQGVGRGTHYILTKVKVRI